MRQAIRAMLDRKLVHERKCERCGVPFVSRNPFALICGRCKAKQSVLTALGLPEEVEEFVLREGYEN